MKRLFGVLFVLGATLLPAAAADAAPAPAWSITAVSYPTNFAPGATYEQGGPAYKVEATNVGGAPTSGTFTITDTLPGSLQPSKSQAPYGAYDNRRSDLSCKTSGRRITCTGAVPPVGPNEGVGLVVPVDVSPSAAPVALDKATIEGGGALADATTTTTTTISSSSAPFGFVEGFAGLHGSTTDAEGGTPTQAGSHPYEMTIAGMSFPTVPNDRGPARATLVAAGGGVRDVVAELPKGLVVNPGATPVLCTEAELETPVPVTEVASCPDASQIGTVGLTTSVGNGLGENRAAVALYNMVPPAGAPAEFGFEPVTGIYIHLLASVRSDGTYVLSAKSNDILAKVAIAGVQPELWGDPSAESHDRQRGHCASGTVAASEETCPVERTHKALLTLPSSCGGPLQTQVSIDSWEEPGVKVSGSYESTDLQGNPVGIDGCAQLPFEPTIESKATTAVADSPSGLAFDLHQPQHEGFEELATANLEGASVTLPAGLTLNPAAANGLAACTSAQIGLSSPVGQSPIRFREEPQTCPDAAKVGTVEVLTPLLKDQAAGGQRQPHVLPGSVYLATPFDNPFDSLLAIYLAIEDPQSGIIAKLAGKVEANPLSGQLTATFTESPELPLEDVKLALYGGARGTLTTPLTCGTKTTVSDLTPWSTPEGADASPSDSFATSVAPFGGACPASEAAAPSVPSFEAGTVSPLAGSYSPFVLKLGRADGTQHLTAVDVTLPQGLLGRLAGVPYCSEAGIALAKSREAVNQGVAERSNPSCPATSEVGNVTVGAGSGPGPFFVQGHAYLAGPYKGAPLSLVIITPAVAGPFDLGDVVVRAALYVDPTTAQIHAVSDALPTILQGIPLDVRSIALTLDRPGFTLNPTSCEVSAIAAAVTTQAGVVAPLQNRFQVGGCGGLKFKPKLKLRLKGATGRSKNPALKAVLTQDPGQANIGRVAVTLPKAEFIDNRHINNPCTRVQFNAGAGNGAECPAGSILGYAKAYSPLLAAPLQGPVYFRSNGGERELPDLVASLSGQVHLNVVGFIDSVHKKGSEVSRVRNTFALVPDAPVSRFVLNLKGGKKGLLQNSKNLCKLSKGEKRARVNMVGQNGKRITPHPVLTNQCGKGNGNKGKGKR